MGVGDGEPDAPAADLQYRALLEQLARRGVELRSPTGMFECRKGSIWELTIENGVPVAAAYREPPGLD